MYKLNRIAIFLFVAVGSASAYADVFDASVCSGTRVSKALIQSHFAPGSTYSGTIPANYEAHLRTRACNEFSGCSSWVDQTAQYIDNAYKSSPISLGFGIGQSGQDTYLGLSLSTGAVGWALTHMRVAALDNPNEQFSTIYGLNPNFHYSFPAILSKMFNIDWDPRTVGYIYLNSPVSANCLWVSTTLRKSSGANTIEAQFIEYLVYQL